MKVKKTQKIRSQKQIDNDWKAGESGNLAGRPKGTYNRKQIMRAIANKPLEELYVYMGDLKKMPKWLQSPAMKKRDIFTVVTERQYVEALNGDTQAYNAINKAMGEMIELEPSEEMTDLTNTIKEYKQKMKDLSAKYSKKK